MTREQDAVLRDLLESLIAAQESHGRALKALANLIQIIVPRPDPWELDPKSYVEQQSQLLKAGKR